MGLFDYVECSRPEFVCSEGHDLSDHEFQTKDLGCTMGDAIIGDTIDIRDGGWGDTQPRPFTGTIDVYTSCRRCPVFLQAETFNEHPVWVEFSVVIKADKIVSVTRTSPDSATQIAEAPTLDYMPDCRGPFDWATAQARRRDRKFFPWDPIPVVGDEVKERQRKWRERVDKMRRKR